MTGDDQEGAGLMTFIGERLRLLREQCGVSPADAARSLGLSDQAYLNRETGATETKVFEVVILAGLFGVDPWVVFDGADAVYRMPAPDCGPAALLADEAEDFLRCLSRIGDPEIRLGIADAIRALARVGDDDS